MQRNGITVAKVTDPDAASKLQRKPKERKVVTHKVESSKQPLITTDRFKREYETELRQRNHKVTSGGICKGNLHRTFHGY